ncbi:hypothetical protein [Chenggangzhangella methanolivorans]|uniref:Uncharacterized protein n=1 Tax=Chenggangzhangella methanolivorans TaxID=1437009 RepID=A0A9E6UJE8_9HYPH|nr:hypothetical protein [Chenggangzhangella methanolivorans]QZO01878.1 hypothetical protein K6K41_11340 [Chenggangzhangella methanolivorans]
MYRTAMTLGLAVAVGLGGVSSANAGLLDFLFGWAKRPPAAPVAAAPHPDLTLSPAKPRRTARAKPKTPRAPVQISPKDMLARTIDPAKNPNWYLEDPTLRRGDILVLSDRVLVFKGGPIGVAQNYAALSNTF